MLSIKLMDEFLDTVDQARMQSLVVNQIAAKWSTGPVTIDCLRASANFTTIIETQEKDRIVLRFTPVSDRPIARLRSELELIRQLAHHGIRTASILSSRSGNDIELVSTHLGDFHGIAFSVLPGEHFEIDKLERSMFRDWGKALAKLHIASENVAVDNRPGWASQIRLVKEVVPKDKQDLLADLAVLEQELNQLPVSKNVFGLIHYDFELDNILWEGGKPGIIDFDDSGYSWFAADIVIAMRGLFDNRIEKINIKDWRFQAFTDGYRSLRKIEAVELRRFPLFLRLHNLVTYARIHRAISEEINEEIQWLKELRQELQGRLEKYQKNVEMHPIGSFYKAWCERF